MQISQSNLLFRGDTFLGVCEALGEDFRFNPFWLRAALGIGLIWNPLAVVGTYLALGVLVLISRVLAPNPRSAAMASASEPAAAPQVAEAGNDEEALAVAA